MRLRLGLAPQIPGDGWRFRGFGTFGAPPTLRVGSSGQAVTDLQEMLNARGYLISINGRFDSISTLNAVINFQRDNGLNPDGIVGPLTWGKLNPSYGGPAGAAPTPAKSTTVTVGTPIIERVSVGGLPFDPLMIGGGLLAAFAAYQLFFAKRKGR